MRKLDSSRAGSVLIWTVLVITILSLVAAELLQIVSGKYHSALHTSVWQESLLAAESGVDLAIVELRKSLYPSPNGAWTGWLNDGTTSHGLTTVPNAGLAGTPMTIDVSVDAPATLKDPASNWQYYRIRTTGSMPLTGPARASDNKQDTRLRKMNLRWDRFTSAILGGSGGNPSNVTRRIETIVRPVGSFDQAIVSVGGLDLNNSNIIIDSYDSRDPNKSTAVRNADGSITPGLYDPNERQQHGNIATDGNILNAGNAHIYGDVATNAGTATGIANVTGVQRTDFYQEPIPVGAPNWPSINPNPSFVNNTTNLTASSTDGSPSARYVLNSVTIAGNDVLTLKGNPDGSPSYIEVYVTGDVSATGNSQIVLGPGVKAKLYFAGNVNIAGNGVVNSNNQPGDLAMYGVKPPPNTSRSFNLGGNALLSAAVYAPDFDIQVNNGGTRGTVYGSFVGKSVAMVGVTDLHYDEALGVGGIINNYKIVSWFEDTR